MSSTSNHSRAAVPAWLDETEREGAESLVAAVRAMPGIAPDGRTFVQVADAWARRLEDEDRRAVKAAAILRDLRARVDAEELDNSRLLARLQRWKRWFSQAMVAQWTLRFLARDATGAWAEAIVARRAEAESYVAGRLREQDEEKSDR